MYGYEQDIASISKWLQLNKVAPTTFGLVLGNSVSLTSRVLKGNCTLKTLRKTLRHIQKYPKVRNRYKGR